MNTFDVIVKWTGVDKGGMKRLPTNDLFYVTTEPMEGLSGEMTAWSLVLDINKNYCADGKRTGFGRARFLVHGAPEATSIKSANLKIFEGRKFVAVIEVVQDK